MRLPQIRRCFGSLLMALLLLAPRPAVASDQSPPARPLPTRPPGPFRLVDGDRVVWLGDALIERAQSNDYVEARLVRRYPGLSITFRNLGWSGDTPFGDSRAGFGSAADGFKQLTEHITTLQPTVIFVAYGGVSSFEGPAGLPRFLEGLKTLLVMLDATRAQLVIVSPIPHENLGPPYPDPAPHNANLQLYRDALRKVAAERKAPFVDLLSLLPSSSADKASPPVRRLTDNGIHLNALGYWYLAAALEEGLGWEPLEWRVEIGTANQSADSSRVKLSDVKSSSTAVSFQTRDEFLPRSRAPGASGFNVNERVLKVTGLNAGIYRLNIDDQPVLKATADEWAQGVVLMAGPEFVQVEQLRATIVRKNRLYFYRWRPQNETYLFGFRKHEQGQNAKEIPLFDPLIAEQENVISRLAVPVPHRYEIQAEK